MNRLTEPKWHILNDDSPDRPFTNRVFVPLSENSACHARCAYCYIPGKGEVPVPIAPEKFKEQMAAVSASPDFSEKTLVSFGCVDDPFSPELVPNLLLGLEHFSAYPLTAVQLASKLEVPSAVREFASSHDYGGAISACTVDKYNFTQ